MNAKQHRLSAAALMAAATALGNTAIAQTTVDPVATDAAAPAPGSAADPVHGGAPTIPLAEDARSEAVERTWPNRPLLITGLVVLGGTYGASAIVGAASDREADERLFLPVVGPWLDLKDRDCDVNACSHETLNKTLLIGSGALQGIGALSVILSLVIPEAREKPWYLIGDENLSVAPQMGANETGLTAFGRF